MALLGSNIANEVGLRLLLCPLGSNIVLRTACCSVGIGLPVYLQMIAAYGSFSLVEIFSDKLISWCPMYYHMKFAFLVWLQLPTVDGAKQLYTNHLRPFFLKHQAIIDRVLVLTYSEVHKLLSAHEAEIEYARAMVTKMLGSDQAPNSDLPQHNAIEGQIRPPNPDLPGQNAIEDQTRLEQYQFWSLITRISVITKRRIVIAFRM